MIAAQGNRLSHVANGQIKTDAKLPLAERLFVLDTLLADVLAAHDRTEVLEKCLAEEVPAGKVNSIADIFADEHFLARGNLAAVAAGDLDKVIVPGVVPRLSATPGRIDHLGPALGNANADVLGGLLGLHAEEIGRLRRQRVV